MNVAAGKRATAATFCFLTGLGSEPTVEAMQSYLRAALPGNRRIDCDCRANGNTNLFLKGAMCEAPAVSCDTLMIFPSGDLGFCTEGQAKSSGQYVKSPGTFKYALCPHMLETSHTNLHYNPAYDATPAQSDVLSDCIDA